MTDKKPPASLSRWWLKPALARMAFGTDTQAGGEATSGAFITAMSATLLDDGALDLTDPAHRDFDDYELLELIGQGGMGRVYRARERSLDREVALKVLSAGHWAAESLVDGLRREAQHTALLQHPNIIAVYAMGEHAGLLYYTMPLVRGRALAQHIDAEGPLPPRDAARLLRVIAEAVDYAHRLGVLHLDLKPGNILIDDTGAPLIADFGLARRLEQALDYEGVSGTPSYMAPEQARGDGAALSPATDVWALGAVLYEMLCGHPPFEGENAADTLRLLLSGEAGKAPRHLAVPADLEAICLRCMQPDPAARYPSARALADDLGRFLEGRAVSVRPLNPVQKIARWARREKVLAATATAAVLALVVGMIATSVQKQRADTNAANASTRLWESRREAAFNLERDGRGFEALPRLLLNMQEQEAAGQTGDARFEHLRIGMLMAQGATLIDRMVVADANPLALDISPDGRTLALACNDLSVRWYDTATLAERGRVSLQDRATSDGQPRAPMLLRFAGNRQVRVTLEWYGNSVNPTDSDSWLVDLDRGALVEPPATFANLADAVFSADGRHALLRDGRHRVQLWQVAPWKPVSGWSPPRADVAPWIVSPDARHAVMLRIMMRNLLVYTLPDLTHAYELRLPPVSAWALSHDGRTLALGDAEGRAYVFDLDSRQLTALPVSRGRHVTWLAFSEDDAWLAVANRDGAAHAIDLATRESLVAGDMRHDFALQRVDISRREHLVIAAGEGGVALWRIPRRPVVRTAPARRIGASPLPQNPAGRYAIGWSMDTGLLATAGLDGQVRLWRLPRPLLHEGKAPMQIAETLWFDGRRLVDVAWDQVRIVSLDGKALTPWLRLARPPGFAELVDDGRTLLLTVGPQLHVYDAATLKPRIAPIALPATPQRLSSTADGRRVALGFGGRNETGFTERVLVYDTQAGRALRGEAVVQGPLRRLAFSPEGGRLLAVGPAAGATTVFAADTLQPIGEYPHDPFQPVVWADFRREGDDVLLATRAMDERLAEDAALAWNPARDEVTAEHDVGAARPLSVIDTAGGIVVAGSRQTLLDPGGPHARTLQRWSREDAVALTAASPDGRIVAHAHQLQVQLYDSRSGDALGPPLEGGGPVFDIITQLAFSTDGQYLLARTQGGYWTAWQLAADAQATEAARELARLGNGNSNQRRLEVPSPAARAALRARDPGPWAAPSTPPLIAAARILADGQPIPPRSPAATPLQLDLGAAYTMAPDSTFNPLHSVRVTLRGYAVGLQRIDGVDYDIRGMAEQQGAIDDQDAAANPGYWHRDEVYRPIPCHAVPPVAIAAVRPLLAPSVWAPVADERTLVLMRLHYRDGGSADVPLRAGREMPGYAGNDQAVPWTYTGRQAWVPLGLEAEVLIAPRLPNPHPQRLVRCLELRPATFQPFGVLAITVEPNRASHASGHATGERTLAGAEAAR